MTEEDSKIFKGIMKKHGKRRGEIWVCTYGASDLKDYHLMRGMI